MKRSRAWRLLEGVMTAALCSCATEAPHTQQASTGPVVQLHLAHPDDSTFLLGAQPTALPTLLFLFATYDTASQLALAHLERFLGRDKRVAVLGIALQPDARSFLGIYRDALDVDFPLAYDPEGLLLLGQSDLGRIQGVPAFVVLDAQGRLHGTRYGVATEEELDSFVSRSLR